jgi:predicted SnoaL-like aldol condensation-catalyzing enzyme
MPTSRRALATLPLLAAAPAAQAQPARDFAREERNRALVIEFYEGVFQRRDLGVAERLLAEGYIQHNPRVPDGRDAFIAAFRRIFAANPQGTSRIVRSATDGDLVYLHVHSRSNPDDRGRAIVDIFRVAEGRIVEHWDVIQDVPETSANTNTMF